MPSGKTHDRITWICLPLVGLASWWLSHDLATCLSTSGSFVFAGLMFSGDLDVKSVQYKRWGWFRWIWIPYQKGVSHRSPLSHGPVLGVIARLTYLSLWLLLGFWLWIQLATWAQQQTLAQQSYQLMEQAAAAFYQHPGLWGGALAGLWLGGLSHTLADESGSRWKRWRRKARKKTRKSSTGRNR